jgi:membrane-bound lytic murein transglycosylase D
VDQASIVIREANDQYLLGEEAYRGGNLDRARAHFDAAALAFLSSGLPIHEEPRLREAYARLLQDIQSLDAEALAAADDQEAAEGEPGEETGPVEELKNITSFLTPDELALEMEKIRPVTETVPFSIPVVLNEKVLTFIEAFQNQLRRAFVGGYQRMGQYEEMIRRTLREEGLPEDLIYLAFLESTFKPQAYSRARAKGIWQFMASTGARYGLVRNAYVDERSDPEKATRAAARYLKDLYAMFGDWYLVMAAYNAGEGVILRAIDRTGKRDFWEFTKTRHLRTETKNFVPSILALSIMSRDPARYGYEGLQKDPPLDFDRVTLDGATDLGLVARLTGSSVEEIRRLNPQLTRNVTPPGYRAYQIRVPRGTGESFQTAYAAMPASEKVVQVRSTYRVRKGDSLASVARRFGTSTWALAEANGISPQARLSAGMALMVPGGLEAAQRRGRSRTRGPAAPPVPGSTYVIRPGDTLSAIARSSGTTVAALASLNGITERTVLRPGRSLKIPGAASGPGPQPAAPKAPEVARGDGGGGPQETAGPRKVAHKVRPGDNLYRIAMRYGTTVESLREWNGLHQSNLIRPGDVLTIYVN